MIYTYLLNHVIDEVALIEVTTAGARWACCIVCHIIHLLVVHAVVVIGTVAWMRHASQGRSLRYTLGRVSLQDGCLGWI